MTDPANKPSGSDSSTVAGELRLSLRGGQLTNPATGKVVDVGIDPITVGRNAESDLRVADDKQVSGRHCLLSASERGVLVEDLDTTNGTWIGTTRIARAHLTSSASLRVGNTVLEFTFGGVHEQPLPQRFGALESHSPKMQATFDQLSRAAKSMRNILLLGETGVGKSHIAEQIHRVSGRTGEFHTVDVSTLTPSLIESELFGHEKGAFSGADTRKISPIELANNGTLFLDEIGDLPYPIQGKLLRVLDTKLVQPVGASRPRQVDVRIISATLHDLPQMVDDGRFRPDLYNRLGVAIRIPPLRDRKQDIPLIVERIFNVAGATALYGHIDNDTKVWLASNTWSGNVRMLSEVLKLAIESAEHEAIDVRGAYALFQSSRPDPSRHALASVVFDKKWLAAALADRLSIAALREKATAAFVVSLYRECGENIARAARRAQMSRRTIRGHLREAGMIASSARDDEDDDE